MSDMDGGYLGRIQAWRAEREARLRAEDGWLSVAGLHWLAEGPNTVGTGEGSDVRLPGDFGAAGVLHLREGAVAFDPAAGVLVNGAPAGRGPLRPDGEGPPDKVSLGAVRFVILRRGGRLGVRVFDNDAPARAGFGGLAWFPVRPELRVVGRLEPHPGPRAVRIVNLLGDVNDSPSPGFVAFELGGQTHRLLAESRDPEGYLFFNFRDATGGVSTYPPGRFLSTEGVRGGEVVLDFNQAVNPPCAFTAFATCPLAPAENRLPLALEAGEKLYLSPPDRRR